MPLIRDGKLNCVKGGKNYQLWHSKKKKDEKFNLEDIKKKALEQFSLGQIAVWQAWGFRPSA